MATSTTAPTVSPSMVVNTESTLTCVHGGSVSATTLSQRVSVDGSPALAQGDLLSVSGCPFSVGPTTMPCVMGQVLAAAHRVTVEGRPVVTTASTLMTTGAGPPVPILIVRTQSRVSAR